MSAELESAWLAALNEVANCAAHELKDCLNGVSLNVEVMRSRAERSRKEGGMEAQALSAFANAASSQLELLTARTESLLFLARPHRPVGARADLAAILRHLSTLLVPSARSDGGTLVVEGVDAPVETSADPLAARLGLAAGLLALVRTGGSARCTLNAPGADDTPGPVVRFSHESAGTCSLDTAIADALAEHFIRTSGSRQDLTMVFPGT